MRPRYDRGGAQPRNDKGSEWLRGCGLWWWWLRLWRGWSGLRCAGSECGWCAFGALNKQGCGGLGATSRICAWRGVRLARAAGLQIFVAVK